MLLLWAVGLSVGTQAAAQEVEAPVINTYDFNDDSCIRNLSDNGTWAVAYGVSAVDGSRYTNARLINVRTQTVTVLGLEEDEDTPLSCRASDVSDDGVVVGMYKDNPAVWTEAGGWQELQAPDGWTTGYAASVTPDGRYAVGCMTDYTNGYREYPVMWDLGTRTIVETPGYPTVGAIGEEALMVRYTSISSNARYIVGIVDFSYVENTMYFVYDRTTATWSRPGFDADGTPWTDGLASVDGEFSPDGKWFAGSANIVSGTSDYDAPFRYNMDTKEFELFDSSEISDLAAVRIDNSGTMFASTPSGTPVRSQYIRVGKFWYALDELLKQRYGIDFYGKTSYDNTGTCMGVSSDGMIITGFPDPYRSYVMEMKETFAEAASHIDLFSGYTVTPADGSSFTKLKSLTVEFPRNIEKLGADASVVLYDENGSAIAKSIQLSVSNVSSDILIIDFRTRTLDAGKKYTVTIPAGTVALKADPTRTNSEMVLSYTGREAVPVAVTAVSPEDGSMLSMLDVSTNPVLLTFDTDVQLTDTANVKLYREGDESPISDLQLASASNQVMVYPTSTEYLYLDTKYRLVLGEGSVTDINGDNPNKQYEVSYEGLYERIVVADDTLMFSEDFTNGVGGMLLYEGDHNMPDEEMQGYTFLDADNCPWIPVRDADNYDFAAASTSAYSPAGKSDDWMMTPQIYIPDAKCRLEFQAQGFRKTKTDKLKVIVYSTETVFNYLSADEVEEIRANGEVVMDEVVLPGASEDDLAGDWTTYTFPLDKYSKKSIYVAFVNENEDQSMVFVDNIKVIRDNGFLTALTSPTTVVALTEQTVTGRVIANADSQTFGSLNVQLLDADKNKVDEVSATGLSLSKGDKYDFAFAKALPLEVGEINTFYLRVQLDESFDTVKYTVKDLAFQPVKRVVVEEMTGQDCGNCPLGHLAFEYMESLYGSRIIPLSYHTYTGDSYESGMSTYVSGFLGLSAAPSGRVNRGSVIGSPMYDNLSSGQHVYTYTSPAGDCWLDLVKAEFDTDADANIDIMSYYDESTQKVNVKFAARFAMNEEKQNIGLFLVVAEDNLSGYQSNYFYSADYEGLGEWGKGGKYASKYVVYSFNDVVRAQVGTSYYGTTGYIPSTIENGKTYSDVISFDLPTVNEIYNCKVVCMMIDANTGTVINSARSKVYTLEDYINGISGADASGAADGVHEVARYNAAGRMIAAPQKGLNIIRMSDGTVRKVLVK